MKKPTDTNVYAIELYKITCCGVTIIIISKIKFYGDTKPIIT